MPRLHGFPSTVGDLIDLLEPYDRDMEVVAADGRAGNSDNFEEILTVAPLPPDNQKVAVF